MTQSSQLANGPVRDWSAELRNYFLPLPSRHMFSLIMLNAFGLVLATPLIVINANLVQGIQGVLAVIVIFLVFLPLGINCIRLVRYYLRPRPTDQEYDTWVRGHISPLYQRGFSQLTLDLGELVEKPQCIAGIVWPDSQEAEFYRDYGYPMIKWDRYGFPHASVNRFIFFYPTRDAVAMFTCDVNTLSNTGYSRAQRYFYKDIVGFDVLDLKPSGNPLNASRQFQIRTADGRSIDIPISPSDPDAMNIVKVLNALLRDHQKT